MPHRNQASVSGNYVKTQQKAQNQIDNEEYSVQQTSQLFPFFVINNLDLFLTPRGTNFRGRVGGVSEQDLIIVELLRGPGKGQAEELGNTWMEQPLKDARHGQLWWLVAHVEYEHGEYHTQRDETDAAEEEFGYDWNTVWGVRDVLGDDDEEHE